MPRRKPEEYQTLERLDNVPEYCDVPVGQGTCDREILTMAYKGTGACGEEHLKIKTNDYGSEPVGVNPTGEC